MPALHQLVAHPLLADLLGPRRDQVVAGGADLRPGLLGELAQPLGLARLGLQVVAQAPGRRHLVLPGDVEGEAVLAEQLLLGLALVRAGHVGGRHRDQVGARPDLGDGGRHPGGAEQVDLDGLGQRRVEGDRGGRVDDDVGCRPARRGPRRRARARRGPRPRRRPGPGGPPRRRSRRRARRAGGRSSRS